MQNRIALAPLTRFRADDNHVPLPFVSDYYVQRASTPGTLLITEATFIAPQAGGYANVPGIWNQEQIEGWKKVVADVHAKGSFIYLQLWALGRAAKEANLKSELGPSAAVKSSGNLPIDGSTVPTPLTEEEIVEYVGLYAQAAKNAVAAGFDGVEIHGANGYLIDQFTQDVANNRTDRWGGSVENRARFGLEVAKAVVDAIGADRTGIRLSAYSDFQNMKMKDPVPQFTYLVEGLKKLNLAYLHLVTPRVSGIFDTQSRETVNWMVDLWGKTSPVFLAGGFTPEVSVQTADVQYKDRDVVIVFGRYFISNPDLVFRIKEGIPLRNYDRDTFYNPKSRHGYTTWAFSEEFEAKSQVQPLKI